VALLFVQCGDDQDPFLISQGRVGHVSQTTQMRQIDSLFANDSIVRLNPVKNALGTQGEVEIYEKGGELLLLLQPEREDDPNSTISTIHVYDSRYQTEKGLNTTSTFKDVKENYTIADIETTISSVVLFLEDSDVYLTIDKKQLPEDLRYNPNIEIEANQIPNEATIKYFMVGWDAEDAPDNE
jgi:hypothetical protein